MFDNFIDSITKSDLSEQDKLTVLKNAEKLKSEKVHVLITGATGCGKSSTINALFGREIAKVGQSSNPETMDIARYDFNNVVLFDSPGLGDGKEADLRHSKNIVNKLLEKDHNGNLLIDLVLVILDGGSRDLGTSYELINSVIIPALGEDKSRLLIAINQADVAMKGRYWDYENNQPEPKLVEFLDEKVASTQKRIKEATGVTVEPIYYSAGYKDGDDEQYPWNLAKLLSHILKHTSEEKRIVYASEINQRKEVWQKNDELEDYQSKVKEDFITSFINTVAKGAGELARGVVEGALSGLRTIGNAIGSVASAVSSGIGSIARGISSFFGW